MKYTDPAIQVQERETSRTEAFSDGVFAIAITLLVLDLKIPRIESGGAEGQLLPMLLKQWPSMVAYITSFVTILIMWINHHNLFSQIRRVDNAFMFFNGLLLFFVTFVPFPTGLLAEYFRHQDGSLAAALYAGTYFLTAICYNLVWRYASHKHRLIKHSIPQEDIDAVNKQYLLGPLVYGLATVVAFWSLAVSFMITVLLAGFYAVTGSMSRNSRLN